jgi:hypothetical protein
MTTQDIDKCPFCGEKRKGHDKTSFGCGSRMNTDGTTWWMATRTHDCKDRVIAQKEAQLAQQAERIEELEAMIPDERQSEFLKEIDKLGEFFVSLDNDAKESE